MPKERKPYDPWEKYRGAVIGRMLVLDMSFVDLAQKLNISPVTARKHIKEPGRMTLDQMRAMNRALDIEAAAARELLSYK